MRVLIMSDMEGVSGIVVWEQVNGGAVTKFFNGNPILGSLASNRRHADFAVALGAARADAYPARPDALLPALDPCGRAAVDAAQAARSLPR